MPGGPVSGRVRDSQGYAVPGAEVQVCPAPEGQCYDAPTTTGGAFTETVPDGGYVLTAFPPPTSSYVLARSTSSAVHKVDSRSGVAGLVLVLKVLDPLPGHVSIDGQDGGVPVLYAFGPAPMTVRGCRHGIGEVTIRGTDTETGQNVAIVVPLVETRPGSGVYSVVIPPVWPVHGDVSFSYYIHCLEGVAPTAGLSAGGNVVTINGSGFTGATTVKFGTAGAESFRVLSASTIEAVAPPGSGTVNISVTTPSGSTKRGPLSAYTYISLSSVTPSGGPDAGGTKVVIRGSELGHIDTLWFGNEPVSDIKVVSQDEIETVSPQGSSDAPITIGQLGEAVAPSTAPTLFFDFGGAPVPSERPGASSTSGAPLAPAVLARGAPPARTAALRAGPPPAITVPKLSLTAPAARPSCSGDDRFRQRARRRGRWHTGGAVQLNGPPPRRLGRFSRPFCGLSQRPG